MKPKKIISPFHALGREKVKSGESGLEIFSPMIKSDFVSPFYFETTINAKAPEVSQETYQWDVGKDSGLDYHISMFA